MVKGQKIKETPRSSGVYFFKNAKNKIMYIGKAADLRNRLRSYFSKSNKDARVLNMLKNAEKVSWQETPSEIEALILESQLIKKYRPDFNVLMRDDKQYFYVGFTKEKFPKVFLTHQPTPTKSAIHPTLDPRLVAREFSSGRMADLVNTDFPISRRRLDMPATLIIGPFTDGTALKMTLKLLRRIFPYCTCKQTHHNYCLNYHLGNCLGFCCLKTQPKDKEQGLENYGKNIKAIKKILSGERTNQTKNMAREMSICAEKDDFENAIKIRKQIESLNRVFENAKIIKETQDKNKTLIETQTAFSLPVLPKRIEAYDISHIQGTSAVGSMVVFNNGQPDKNQYRKFRIKAPAKPDDTGMLKEIMARRFKHPEWPLPDLIIIDGGKAQLNTAIKTTPKNISVIALTKNSKHKGSHIYSTTSPSPVLLNFLTCEVRKLILQANGEAHRFAISYYRKLHEKNSGY